MIRLRLRTTSAELATEKNNENMTRKKRTKNGGGFVVSGVWSGHGCTRSWEGVHEFC